MPELASIRGAGLGNELFPWAKAVIAAAELGLTAVHPAWALNPRRYRSDFGTSRWDWAVQRGIRAVLPVIRVTAEDVLAKGTMDYADVVRPLLPEVRSSRVPIALVHASGMVGGYRAIQAAKPAMRALLFAPRHVARDLYTVESARRPDKVQVAIHVRAGHGFGEGPPAPGEFNRRLPTSWYASVVDAIATAFSGDSVQVALIGDAVPGALEDHVARRCRLLSLPPRRRPLLSDLFLLASADLLVCSVSSFSQTAAFLGEGSYIWYGPHLSEVAEGRAIWPTGATVPLDAEDDASIAPRGVAIARATLYRIIWWQNSTAESRSGIDEPTSSTEGPSSERSEAIDARAKKPQAHEDPSLTNQARCRRRHDENLRPGNSRERKESTTSRLGARSTMSTSSDHARRLLRSANSFSSAIV